MLSCIGNLNLRDKLIYLDGIVIFSKAYEEHVGKLKALFEQLHEDRLKLKGSKCELFLSHIVYLRFIDELRGF